jgi:hypothetical protein
MMHRPWNTVLLSSVAALALVLPSMAWVADDGGPARTYCAEPRGLREVPQDEDSAISELCRWRDDSLRPAAEREMTLTQDLPPVAKINLTMEQRHVIKEIVLKDLKPKKAAAGIAPVIGEAVPAGVDVLPFPPEIYGKVPQIKSHQFFVTDDHVIIVSPKDNTIADVIE